MIVFQKVLYSRYYISHHCIFGSAFLIFTLFGPAFSTVHKICAGSDTPLQKTPTSTDFRLKRLSCTEACVARSLCHNWATCYNYYYKVWHIKPAQLQCVLKYSHAYLLIRGVNTTFALREILVTKRILKIEELFLSEWYRSITGWLITFSTSRGWNCTNKQRGGSNTVWSHMACDFS